jgi:putative transposase
MPRIAREKSEFQTYHIVQRGNERKNIFFTEFDRIRFLNTLLNAKRKYNFCLEAFCLMDNHVHLLIYDNGNDISKIIKSINISYAYYFNHVHNRVGHLFQDRFKSQLIEKDDYLLAASAYIHNNPVKAGIVKTSEDYKWSSMNYFLGRETERLELVDPGRILGILSSEKQVAVNEYYQYVIKYTPEIEIFDVDEDKLLYLNENETFINNYNAAKDLVNQELAKKDMKESDLRLDRDLRNSIIVKLRKNSSLNLKEIGQLCGGISQSLVCKILKNTDSIQEPSLN